MYTTSSDTSTLSLHDALPILRAGGGEPRPLPGDRGGPTLRPPAWPLFVIPSSHQIVRPGRRTERGRSEEHTSELQSRGHLVCRLLLEKKKTLFIFFNTKNNIF